MIRVLLLGAAVLAPAAAAAQSAEELTQRARRLGGLVGDRGEQAAVSAQHKLTEAQALAARREYVRAAVLLYDLVEKGALSVDEMEEALFTLGECLMAIGDTRAARGYYQRVLDRPGGKHYPRALERVVEAGLATGELDGLDEAVASLQGVAPAQRTPSGLYAQGKYLLRKERPDEALAALDRVPAGDADYLRARFLAGAAQVAKKAWPEAIAAFQAVLAAAPVAPQDKGIQEHAQLALGRLFYETGDAARAVRHYVAIPPASARFGEALQEVAWAHVRAGDFANAARSFEVLILKDPESREAPDLEILQGNLLLRLGEFSRAVQAFTRVRDRFEPLYRQLHQRLAGLPDPRGFAEALLAGRPPADLGLPPLAVTWLQRDPRVSYSISLRRGLDEIHVGITEFEAEIEGIGRALGGPVRDRLFPDLTEARARGQALVAEIQAARGRASGAEVARMDEALAVAQQSLAGVESEIASRLAEVEQAVAEERENVKTFRQLVDDAARDADELTAIATLAGIHGVARLLHDFTVRADVGIIDVAWGEKHEQSRAVQALVKGRNDQIQELAREFAEVLEGAK